MNESVQTSSNAAHPLTTLETSGLTQDDFRRKYLLYVDLLAFSQKVMSEPLNEIYTFYAHKIILMLFASTNWAKRGVQFDVVSDSIYIWIDDPEVEDCVEFMRLCDAATTVMHNLLLSGVYPRGAIVYDQFVIGDRLIAGKQIHTILGRAIVKAAEMEKIQQWSGIVLHPNDKPFVERDCASAYSKLRTHGMLVPYDVPLKNGAVEMDVVNINIKTLGHSQQIIDGLTAQIPMQRSADVWVKYQNTIDFIKYCVDNKIEAHRVALGL